jgi:uncharacterized protein (UPF0264 family)
MRLLVSVRDADEARAALEGGADIIDAKDPRRGALGAVGASALRDVVAAVNGERAVSAALGDASNEANVERAARTAASCGLSYVKLGFAGTTHATTVRALLSAAVRGARGAATGTGVIAVAYADADRARSVSAMELVGIAADVGAAGVLLDTAFKDSGGLFTLMDESAVGAWVDVAHAAGLMAAVAGALSREDLPLAGALGADRQLSVHARAAPRARTAAPPPRP